MQALEAHEVDDYRVRSTVYADMWGRILLILDLNRFRLYGSGKKTS